MQHSFGLVPTFFVGKVPFAVSNVRESTELLIETTRRTHAEGFPVRLSNAYCVGLAGSDQSYAGLLNGVGINLPDGAPVSWIMKWRTRGRLSPERVRGPSLFNSVLDHGRAHNVRHFFLGTTDRTLALLEREVQRRYPGAVVSGCYAPEYGPLSDSFYDSSEERICAADPDIIWVALGTPKQDFAAAELARRTNLTCVGVGAAFDFLAGTAPEAPESFQRLGMEWLFRLGSEPKRLWRRYTVGSMQFIYSAIADTGRSNRERQRQTA